MVRHESGSAVVGMGMGWCVGAVAGIAGAGNGIP